MSSTPEFSFWLQALKGESTRGSDAQIRDLIANPGALLSPQAPSSSTSRLPETSAAIRAAITDTFIYSEIAGQDSSEDERAILSNADTVMVGGRRRLRLQPAPRGELVTRVIGTPLYQELLSRATAEDERDFDNISKDEVRRNGAWLRCFLKGQFARLDRPPVSELRSALCAREQLVNVRLPPSVPALAQIKQMLGLAELLEPLRILIGSRGGWDGQEEVSDRFVGRDYELTQLRSYVDVLASESARETIGRGTDRLTDKIGRAFTGRSKGCFVIAARGGLGKSALIAKFVLDHARASISGAPFPFAYIDFDRAGLQPKEPRQLLSEVLRQVALQFDEFMEVAAPIRDQLREDLQDNALPASSEYRRSDECWKMAREALRVLAITHGERFLLVLDTLEIVQSDRRAFDGVVGFANLLCTAEFPEARIVVAGRADVPELRHQSQSRAQGTLFELEPLELEDAIEMADALGQSLLGDSWNPEWGARLAGGKDGPESRREPLTIRVAVELMRAAKPQKRERLSRQIEELGEDASADFVGVLYQRRVLDHVRDDEVRKLAWPGLVLRRVTIELINEVLADICELNRALVPQTFLALGNETWIVTQVGDALKHQPDLRARTLPLMRRHDKKKFDAVNRAAIKFFETRQANDLASKAEWIYHRFLDGADRAELERDWVPELMQYFAGSEAEFQTSAEAAQFLFANTATNLSPRFLRKLPPSLAIEHIANAAPHFGEFTETQLIPELCDLNLTVVNTGSLSVNGRRAHFTLAVKTGRWDLSTSTFPEFTPVERWLQQAEFAKAYRNARVASSTRDPSNPSVIGASRHDQNFPALIQYLAHECSDASGRLFRNIEFLLIEAFGANAWRPTQADVPTLRLAMVLSPQLARLAGRLWFRLTTSESWDAANRTFSAVEIRALAHPESRLEPQLQKADEDLWKVIFHGDEKGKSGESALPPAGFTAQPQITTLVSEYLRELLFARDDPSSTQAIRRFAGARSSDWLLPLAYAAHRATGGSIPPECLDRAMTYAFESRGFFKRAAPNLSASLQSGDMLQLLTLADAANDLGRTLSILNKYAQRDGALDLDKLRFQYDKWRRMLLALPEER